MKFSDIFRSVLPGAAATRSGPSETAGNASSYLPLGQDEATVETPTASREADAAGIYRNDAAILRIKLGRPPNDRTPIASADDARVLRSIDLVLLPLMLSVYFLQALDKATLSYASIFGLIEDTGLVGEQYSWLGSIVYLAQLIMQMPVAYALVKLPIGKFTSGMVLGWGLTLALMAWAKSFPSLLSGRFVLGAFEAGIGPSFVAITQMWWRRREQTVRIGYWYCMNGLTWILGSLITYGLASIKSDMKPYQIIFLFFGVVTIFVSSLMFLWMPDSPLQARYLTDQDKLIAIERLRSSESRITTREWQHGQFLEAMRDIKTWLWVAMIFCISVPSNGISTFGPLIIESFVSDPFQTMLFNVPVGVSHIIAVTGSAYIAMKCKTKAYVIVGLCIPPLIGFGVLLMFPHDIHHRAILLVGYFCLSAYTGITPLIYSWSAQCTAGDTKKKTVSALVFIGSSAGNIIGPLLFTPDEAPEYQRGIRANIVFFMFVALIAGGTAVYLHDLNNQHAKRRVALGKNAEIIDLTLETAEDAERMEQEQQIPAHGPDAVGETGGESGCNHGGKAGGDVTDLENEDFVYVY